MQEEPTTPRRRDRPDPIVELKIRIALSAEGAVLDRVAKVDERVKVSHKSARLTLRSETPSMAMAELRDFAEKVRRATTGERV